MALSWLLQQLLANQNNISTKFLYQSIIWKIKTYNIIPFNYIFYYIYIYIYITYSENA